MSRTHEVRTRVDDAALSKLRRIQAAMGFSEAKAARDAIEYYGDHAPEIYAARLRTVCAEARRSCAVPAADLRE